MGALGDLIPKNTRIKLAENILFLGSVVSIYDEDAKKIKRHIIVGFDNGKIATATVRINSKKNPNFYRNYNEQKLCYFIKSKGNKFLEWDSTVDCSDLIEWPTENLKEILLEESSTFMGQVEDRELDTIRSVIADADTIPPKKKKKYKLK
ncbi:MAG: hypothetical protein JEZ01_03525 [Labilibaculum sp.]|nr:hypothetical protein [Labilibaculum sp.]MBI9056823.1 hypothetical protein [Labilibaculum sp.]